MIKFEKGTLSSSYPYSLEEKMRNKKFDRENVISKKCETY